MTTWERTKPMFVVPPAQTAPEHGHWFVPDDDGIFCRACGLPKKNRRHVEKERAADQ